MAADVLEIKLGILEVEKSEVKKPVKQSKKNKRPPSPQPFQNGISEDDIIEITPEIYHDDDEDDDGSYAPHFLMQVIFT